MYKEKYALGNSINFNGVQTPEGLIGGGWDRSV